MAKLVQLKDARQNSTDQPRTVQVNPMHIVSVEAIPSNRRVGFRGPPDSGSLRRGLIPANAATQELRTATASREVGLSPPLLWLKFDKEGMGECVITRGNQQHASAVQL